MEGVFREAMGVRCACFMVGGSFASPLAEAKAIVAGAEERSR